MTHNLRLISQHKRKYSQLVHHSLSVFSMVQHPYYDCIQDNLQLDQEHMCIHKCIPEYKVTTIIVKNGTAFMTVVKDVGLAPQ